MSTETLSPTPGQWLEGARPKTLPAAVAPVAAGAGVALHLDSFALGPVLLALVVALALQVGVNYANDYSDGVRGTDDARVGPLRLVGSGLAAPQAVKRAAYASLGVAAVAGLVLAVLTAWWLVPVGALCIAAAWFYTGGSRPYGYAGLGEVMVFLFFGLVAVVGTVYVQTESFGDGMLAPSLLAAVAIGAVACAILVVNNLRDVPTDTEAGKTTLAVRLGDSRTRALYALLMLTPAVCTLALAVVTGPFALLGLVHGPLALQGVRTVAGIGREAATGRALVPVLGVTGRAELFLGVGLLVGLAL
ncbi:1,4-dihydroxy-2-naphthoate polyprenyltransferase [Nocardioidaceae bacterium]|nr:1,4-dihydroxy-2-naphthoate polyprenyltransferase [Nocardioidaceae bacterium]